ncbi:MAG: TetR/AcrR family transcriptional regulator [Clostridiales bacterium]|nr:TetR/AcrR family transcriptional regulator [Clostridiales bacterium]
MDGSVTSSQRFFQHYAMQDSVDYFLATLFELMKTRPYRDITVSELCHAVGLSRNTFYKYFKNKDSLLERFSERIWAAFQETMPPSRSLSSGFLHYFEFCYSLKEIVEALVRNDLLQPLTQWNERFIRCIRPAEDVGGAESDPASLGMMYHFISSGCVRLVEDWCRGGFAETPAHMARLATCVVEGRFAHACGLEPDGKGAASLPA